MKNRIQSICSFILSALLIMTLVSVPASAATEDVDLLLDFEKFDVDTLLYKSENKYYLQQITDSTQYSKDAVVADPAGTGNKVYYVNGGKIVKLDTEAKYATTDLSFRVYLPDTAQTSYLFQVYCNGVDPNTLAAKDPFRMSASFTTLEAKNNQIAGKAYEPNTWHTLRYVFENDGTNTCVYRYCDGQLIAFKENMVYDNSFKYTGMNRMESLYSGLHFDDISIAMLANAPSVSLTINGGLAEEDYSVKDVLTSELTATATVSNSTTATHVRFKDAAGNVLGTVALDASGQAELAVQPGTITAEAIVTAGSSTHVVAASEPQTAGGVASEKKYYFYNSYDATLTPEWDSENQIYYDYYGNDGVPETRWSTLNYYASRPANNKWACMINKDGMYGNTANVDGNTVSATGFSLPEDKEGHTIAVKMTCLSAQNSVFKPWIGIGFDPKGAEKGGKASDNSAGWDKFYGMSPTEYKTAGGTAENYEEVMKSAYVVIEQSYKFEDFNVGRNLMMPNWFTVTGNHTWYHRYGGVFVGKSETDTAELTTTNNKSLGSVTKGHWYRITSIYDIKNGVYDVFINGDYKNRDVFTHGRNTESELQNTICMSEIIDWYDRDNADSAMYMDDFSIYMTSFEGNEISDPANGVVSIKNDGTARDISIITAAYSDEECIQLAGVVVDSAKLDAGDLHKTVTLTGAPAGVKTKTFFIENAGGAMKPLRGAYAAQ